MTLQFRDKVDSLQAQLDQEREARIEAEREAARLAGKVEAIEDPDRRSWGQRITGRE